jgi:enamine deaminase RidA (YjgF/YER057c/UK114 family)
MDIARFESRSRYAPTIGFSAAVVNNGLVYLAGISAISPDGEAIGGTDPYLQARECLRKAESTLRDCGSSLERVLHSRVYLVARDHWEQIGTAHGEAFAGARPAATMVVVKELLDPRMLVEMELVAATDS